MKLYTVKVVYEIVVLAEDNSDAEYIAIQMIDEKVCYSNIETNLISNFSQIPNGWHSGDYPYYNNCYNCNSFYLHEFAKSLNSFREFTIEEHLTCQNK